MQNSRKKRRPRRARRVSLCPDSDWADDGNVKEVAERVAETEADTTRRFSKEEYAYLDGDWANNFTNAELQIGIQSLKLPPPKLGHDKGSLKGVSSVFSGEILPNKSIIDQMVQPTLLFNIWSLHSKSIDAALLSIKVQAKVNRYIIHPYSLFNLSWEMLMLVFLLVSIYVLPVEMAFYADSFSAGDQRWKAFNLITDVLFMMNIAKCFQTAYMHKHTDIIIMGNRDIALHYLCTTFAYHVLSSFPFDYIVLQQLKDVNSSSVTSAHILRILRIIRIPLFIRSLNSFLKIWFQLQSRIRRLVCISSLIVICVHWNSCIQYWISFLQGHPDNAWTSITGLVTSNATVFEKFTHSYYRAWSQMVAVGYGMEPSANMGERWVVIFSTALGSILHILLLAQIINIFSSKDLPEVKYDECIQELTGYMKSQHLPLDIQSRALTSFRHRYRQRKYFNENCILDDPHISYPLKSDILMQCSRSLLEKVDFFSSTSPEFLVDLITKLKLQVYLPGDVIIEAGKRGQAMYFIDHGKVVVRLPSGQTVSELGDGQHFGEISLIINERRVASVIAITLCDIFCLMKQDFDQVLNDHPRMRALMEHTASVRLLNFAEKRDSETGPSPATSKGSPKLSPLKGSGLHKKS